MSDSLEILEEPLTRLIFMVRTAAEPKVEGILLDNGAQYSVFCDESLLANFRVKNCPTRYSGIAGADLMATMCRFLWSKSRCLPRG